MVSVTQKGFHQEVYAGISRTLRLGPQIEHLLFGVARLSLF